MFKVEFGKSDAKKQKEMERVKKQMALWDPTPTMESPRSTMTPLRAVDSSGKQFIIDGDGFLLTTEGYAGTFDDVSRLTDDFKPRQAFELEKALNLEHENEAITPITQHEKLTSLNEVHRQGRRSKSKNAAGGRRRRSLRKPLDRVTLAPIEKTSTIKIPNSPASPQFFSSSKTSSPSLRKTLDELYMAHLTAEEDLLANSTSGRLEPSGGRSKARTYNQELMPGSLSPAPADWTASPSGRMPEQMALHESFDHLTLHNSMDHLTLHDCKDNMSVLYSSPKSVSSNASPTFGQKSAASTSASTLQMATPRKSAESAISCPTSNASSDYNGHRGHENSLMTFQRFVGEDVTRETTLKAYRSESMKDIVTRLQKSGSKVLRFSHEEAEAIKKGEKLISFSLSQLSKVKFSKEAFGDMSSSEVLDMSPIRPVVIEIMVEGVEEGEDLSIF